MKQLKHTFKPLNYTAMTKEKFYHLPMNLQEGIVHTNQPNTVNTVCAIYSRHKERVCIRLGYQSVQDEIMTALIQALPKEPVYRWERVYGDSFSVNTWDKLL